MHRRIKLFCYDLRHRTGFISTKLSLNLFSSCGETVVKSVINTRYTLYKAARKQRKLDAIPFIHRPLTRHQSLLETLNMMPVHNRTTEDKLEDHVTDMQFVEYFFANGITTHTMLYVYMHLDIYSPTLYTSSSIDRNIKHDACS